MFVRFFFLIVRRIISAIRLLIAHPLHIILHLHMLELSQLDVEVDRIYYFSKPHKNSNFVPEPTYAYFLLLFTLFMPRLHIGVSSLLRNYIEYILVLKLLLGFL